MTVCPCGHAWPEHGAGGCFARLDVERWCPCLVEEEPVLADRLAALKAENDAAMKPLRDMGGEVPFEVMYKVYLDALADMLFPEGSELRLKFQLRVEQIVAEHVVPMAVAMTDARKVASRQHLSTVERELITPEEPPEGFLAVGNNLNGPRDTLANEARDAKRRQGLRPVE